MINLLLILFLVIKIELKKRRWQSQSELFDGGDFGWDVLWRGHRTQKILIIFQF